MHPLFVSYSFTDPKGRSGMGSLVLPFPRPIRRAEDVTALYAAVSKLLDESLGAGTTFAIVNWCRLEA